MSEPMGRQYYGFSDEKSQMFIRQVDIKTPKSAKARKAAK